MNKSKYSRILDNILDEKVRHDHHLAPQILTRIQKNKGANMSKRMKVLVPILTVMLAVLLFTVPAVAQAIQRWIGYVPGFGLVKEGSVRVIDQPVQVIQDGVTLTVTEVTSSSSKTVIRYNFKNIPTTPMDEVDSCKGQDARPDLVLSDGSEPYLLGLGGEVNETGYLFEATYNGVPENVTEMTLVIKCPSQIIPGSISWEWKVPLSFDSQIPALTMAPVFDVPAESEQAEDGISMFSTKLDVKQIIPLADGYILSGSMSVDPVSGLTVEESDGYLEDMVIKDANDVVLTLARVPDDFLIEGDGNPNNQFNWAVQISGKNIVWPLTMTVNSVNAVTPAFPMSTFQVDVGQDPQPGQVWTIEKDVALGPKFVHVVSLNRLRDDNGFDGYEFTFIFDPGLYWSYQIAGAMPTGGGGGGGETAGEHFTLARSYRGNIPTGLLTIELNGYGIEQVAGPWQVSVAEPAAQ
ncbi:MAG: hypothetical protein C0410_12725 [Anaerolinea sp.]|nr:hypothetical protein [Anaerolinea sp.]